MFIDKATLLATITNVDNGGSDIRITAPSHGLTTGDTVFIAGIGGTTEANGTFTVTVLSSSQFTLDSTTFTNNWAGGGGVYSGWRLQLGLTSPNFDAVAILSVKRFTNGVVSAIETVAKVISAATTTLLESDPSSAYSVESINLLSTESTNDLVSTISLKNKSNTEFKYATATIEAGGRWSIDKVGTSSRFTTEGAMTPPEAP